MATGDKLVNLDELKLAYDTINAGVYSKSQVDQIIAQSTSNTNLNGTVTGYLPVKNSGCAIFSSGSASSAYNVMSQLVTGRCVPFIIANADATSLLTGGKLTSLIKGTLSRTGANGQFYDFIGGPGGNYNKMYSWRVTATSDADMSTQTVHEFTGTAFAAGETISVEQCIVMKSTSAKDKYMGTLSLPRLATGRTITFSNVGQYGTIFSDGLSHTLDLTSVAVVEIKSADILFVIPATGIADANTWMWIRFIATLQFN